MKFYYMVISMRWIICPKKVLCIILSYIILVEQFDKSNNYMSKKMILLDATSMFGHMISFYLRSEKQYE